MRRFWLAVSGVLFLLGSAATAIAQTNPPERAGRISYVEGAVSVRSADQDQWLPAGVNWPVTSGTAIWTQPAARAEIQIGALELRVDQNTELDVIRLDDGVTALAVPQGVASIHLAEADGIPIQIDTPNGPVVLNRPGFYHLENGVVAAVGANATPFDRWAMARAQQATVTASDTLRYVSPQTTGYQDLGAYGSWTVTPDYGPVWYPRAVVAGWAPYRYGHWAYVGPWGWTWIDDAPWGFTPFHYGRWVVVQGRWGWWPGHRVVRPVYTPALVVFIGHGGFHDRHIPPARWIPLAPRETVQVNVNVNVDRFANHRAASSAPRSGFDRNAAAAAPSFQRDRNATSRQPAAVAPRNVPQAVTPTAEPARVVARPVPSDPARHNAGPERPGQDHRGPIETRATPQIAPATLPAPTVVPQAETPRGIARPDTPANWRRNRPEDHRNPPETRLAPPTAAPAVRPYLAPPQTREAVREQRQAPVRAEAAPVMPSPRHEPAHGGLQRQASPPQASAPVVQPQAAPRREAAAGSHQMPSQAPAQARAAPSQPAPQAQPAPASHEQRHPERGQKKQDDR